MPTINNHKSEFLPGNMHDHIPENISNGIKIAVVDLLKPNEVKEKLPKSNGKYRVVNNLIAINYINIL